MRISDWSSDVCSSDLHRDGVALHYGRDDFKNQSQLARALSRERPKDMAQDYTKADPARSFAERHGIGFEERVADIARKVPEKRSEERRVGKEGVQTCRNRGAREH